MVLNFREQQHSESTFEPGFGRYRGKLRQGEPGAWRRATSDSSSAETSLRLRFDAFELDEAEARLTRDGQPVPLAPRPFAVLCALARTPRTLVTKNALLDSVWGHRFVSDSVLKTAVNALRAAMRDDPKQPRYIETVSRHGYRFIGKVGAAATPGELQQQANHAVLERPALGENEGHSASVNVRWV